MIGQLNRKIYILLVEDELGHCELIKRSLGKASNMYQLTIVSNISDAIKEVNAKNYDLVIADYKLPDGTGVDLVETSKRKRSDRQFPVLIITGQGNEQMAVTAMKKGAIDYIVKSEIIFQDMPHIINRVLREWFLIKGREHIEKELRQQKRILEQKNTALNEILKHIEEEKQQIKDNVVLNIETFIMPALDKIKLKGGTKKHIDVIKDNLNDIASEFGRQLRDEQSKLTSREIEICNIIKTGLTNKEISHLLSISPQTVERHRANIRKKMNIVRSDINLTSYLNMLH